MLYMTGYTGDTTLRHGAETAAVELLRKPFSRGLFVHAIRQATAGSGAHRDGT
jgi:hypothetical protein